MRHNVNELARFQNNRLMNARTACSSCAPNYGFESAVGGRRRSREDLVAFKTKHAPPETNLTGIVVRGF